MISVYKFLQEPTLAKMPLDKNLSITLLNIFSDTVTRSGMFCALATVIDRCKTEGIVDVFQVVKALRTSKPSAVPTMVSAVNLSAW